MNNVGPEFKKKISHLSLISRVALRNNFLRHPGIYLIYTSEERSSTYQGSLI
jgi:hypothetical protein